MYINLQRIYLNVLTKWTRRGVVTFNEGGSWVGLTLAVDFSFMRQT